jgi:hypothetical protein
LEVSVLDFLSGDNITINSTNGDHSGFIYQTQLPEKLIEQYEKRLQDKDAEIAYLKQLLDKK